MPFYDYLCDCGMRMELFRPINKRRAPLECGCGKQMELMLSAPALHVWSGERKFPNLRKEGDGAMQFGSKKEYKSYLAANHMAEVSHDAPIKRPHGSKVVETTG